MQAYTPNQSVVESTPAGRIAQLERRIMELEHQVKSDHEIMAREEESHTAQMVRLAADCGRLNYQIKQLGGKPIGNGDGLKELEQLQANLDKANLILGRLWRLLVVNTSFIWARQQVDNSEFETVVLAAIQSDKE